MRDLDDHLGTHKMVLKGLLGSFADELSGVAGKGDDVDDKGVLARRSSWIYLVRWRPSVAAEGAGGVSGV